MNRRISNWYKVKPTDKISFEEKPDGRKFLTVGDRTWWFRPDEIPNVVIKVGKRRFARVFFK